MKSFVVLITVLCLCASSEVLAQGNPIQDDALIWSEPPESQADERSPTTAFLLSFLGTAVPVGAGLVLNNNDDGGPGGAIFVMGGLIGPSLGHFYSGCPGRAMLGVGIRSAALAVTAVAASSVIMESEGSSGEGAMVAGFIAFCASGVIDIATASASANKTNRKLEEQRFELRGERLRSTGELALGLKYRF